MAAGERAWHGFTVDCMVCEARRISRGPTCADAKARGVVTDAYKAELCAVAGDMHWHVMHDLVRAWQRGERPAWTL
jgi:hypothetical protein